MFTIDANWQSNNDLWEREFPPSIDIGPEVHRILHTSESGENFQNLRYVVFDDEAIVRMMMKVMLSKIGCQTEKVYEYDTWGKQFLEEATQEEKDAINASDIVVTDINDNNSDNVTWGKRRAQYAFSQWKKVIFISWREESLRAMQEYFVREFSEGKCISLQKPIEAGALKEQIIALSSHRASLPE